MNTAVINIKTNSQVKAKAQKVAEELGFSLSSLINGYLRHLVKTKTVHFNTSEKPTEYLIQALKESEKDIKARRIISFKNFEDETAYLDKMIENDKNKNN